MASAQKPFACRMCGSSLIPKRWGGGECDACQSVSVTSVPTNDELAEFYKSFNESYSGGGRSGSRNQKRYARRYLTLIRRYVDTDRLIDIGSSTNPFPNIAARKGFDVTVLDYVRPKGLSSKVSFIEGNINDEEIIVRYGNSFDVVTAWAVLEHVLNPQLSGRILASICRPGGMLFLSTPEIGTFMTSHSIGRSGWFHPPEHLHLISPAAVSIIFGDNGCSLVKWGRFELTPARYIARYGVGILEAAVGMPVQLLFARSWQDLRDSRVHKFKGINYFILRKYQPSS